jgi:hypothetical protein
MYIQTLERDAIEGDSQKNSLVISYNLEIRKVG